MLGPWGCAGVCQRGARWWYFEFTNISMTNMYIWHLHEMDKGSFYLFIASLSATSNYLEKLKCFNRFSRHIKFGGGTYLCWIVLREHSTYLTRNINVHFPLTNCLSITCLSINIFLFCQNMTRTEFFHTDIYKIYNQNMVYYIFGMWQRNLEHMSKSGRRISWWILSKFVVKNISGGMFCINNLLLPFCSVFAC